MQKIYQIDMYSAYLARDLGYQDELISQRVVGVVVKKIYSPKYYK